MTPRNRHANPDIDSPDSLIAEWAELCRIPSISGDVDAVTAAGMWVANRLATLTDQVRITHHTDYGPTISARIPGESSHTVLMYTHLDVQPPGDLSRWSYPPFEARIVDGALYARGACDDKADIAARLQAIRAWVTRHTGWPPFTVAFIADPAEEVGSPGLGSVLHENRDLLQADACLWESYLREKSGRPAVGFGCRGSYEGRLALRNLAADQHPSLSPVIRSPALVVLQAVASFIDDNGNLIVDGLTRGMLQPTPEQRTYARSAHLPREVIEYDDGGRSFWAGSEDELLDRWAYAPSLVLGRTVMNEEGVSRVPANAELNFRITLVPDMTERDIHTALRNHLDQRGFNDVELHATRFVAPARSPLDSSCAQAVVAAATAQWGTPVIYPQMTGAGPGKLFLDILGAPIISPTGTLRPDSNMHAPDEHGTIDDYLDHVTFTQRLLEQLDTAWS